MNASLRELGKRAGTVPAPQLDVAALVAAGESRIRRRRVVAVAAVTAAVVAVVGGALLASPGTRQTAPPAGPDHTALDDKNRGRDAVETRLANRLLTYSVGTTIHWGDRTVDVGHVARGRDVRRLSLAYVDATDDGVVFITALPSQRDANAEIGVPYGAASIWFTDGSAPVRIGTTAGSGVRGFGIATSAAGSTLAWKEPGDESTDLLQSPYGPVVVYDTARGREVGRFGGADAFPLEQVFDDAVYWTPDATSCSLSNFGFGPASQCKRTTPVMRLDTASGLQSRVTWADYQADRRGRPGLLTTPNGYEMFLHGFPRGDLLLADGGAPGVGFIPTVTRTGRPLRLHLPARDRNRESLAITQWLDADRVVLVDTDSYDGTDLLVCRLSTGGCRLAVRIPDANYTEPGPTGIHG